MAKKEKRSRELSRKSNQKPDHKPGQHYTHKRINHRIYNN